MHAIMMDETGGPNVMKWREPHSPKPKAGEILIRHQAIGLNFIDTYYRSGLYPIASFPIIPGNEGAGDVVAVGKNVRGIKEGDRVAYTYPLGAYAQERTLPANRVVKLPDGISYDVGAAIMLKGLTAHYLLRRTFRVKKGDTILFHAAAGGVGMIACQWANALGATVIGTAGGKDKVKLAKKNGCHHVIDYKAKDFVKEVSRITKKRGVDVVYDGVGKDTYPGNLDCIRRLGMWVLFGQSSGPVPPVDLSILNRKGSLFATRPSLYAYIADDKDLKRAARELFDVVQDGHVTIDINQHYPLKQAVKAHRDLEGRKTTGATVLVP